MRRRVEPARERYLCEEVRKWAKNSVARRCPVEKLAKRLKISVEMIQNRLKNPRKRARIARERENVDLELKKRAKNPVTRRDTAPKIHRDLALRDLGVRAVQRARKPFRDEDLAKRAKKRRFARKLARKFCAKGGAKSAPIHGLQ